MSLITKGISFARKGATRLFTCATKTTAAKGSIFKSATTVVNRHTEED